jgi:hypothetical protein
MAIAGSVIRPQTALRNELISLNTKLSPLDTMSASSHVETPTGLPLFTRYPGNPILTQRDWPYPINSVFNAGAVRLAEGSTLLLCRVEDRRGLSHLVCSSLSEWIDDWQVDHEPTLVASPHVHPEEIGVLRTPASPMFRTWGNMRWFTRPLREEVLECPSLLPETSRALSDMA